MGSSFKGSNHVKPPDHERPGDWYSFEGGGWHVALISKELVSDASLDRVLSICPGRRPIKSCTEGLAYKGPGCGVVATESGVDFCHKLPPFLFGDAPLKDSGGAFLIELSLVDLVSFGSPHNAACLILVLGELLHIKVGQEGLGPRGDDSRYFVGRRCYFGGRASDYVRLFGGGQCGWVRANIAMFPFPYYGWLEHPFQEDVGGDHITFCADACQDVCRLIVFSGYMVKFESLKPS